MYRKTMGSIYKEDVPDSRAARARNRPQTIAEVIWLFDVFCDDIVDFDDMSNAFLCGFAVKISV